MADLFVDGQGWLWYGDFRLPIRQTTAGKLQFFDKNRRRSSVRGSEYVEVDPAKFAGLEEKGKNDAKKQ